MNQARPSHVPPTARLVSAPLPRLSLDGLNPAQREAVETLSGPLLVLAGAGTGKTRVITYRMANLIQSGIQPDRILAVTFTNKAAKEMQHRTTELLGRRLKAKPFISTFHAYCVGVLRQEIHLLGYPENFVIYDRGDQESAANKALRSVKMADGAMKPSDLLRHISQWKMNGILPRDASEHCSDDLGYLAALAYRKYQTSLKAAGGVDFDDLLMLTRQLFLEFPDCLVRQQQRFDHVQIDEYQDTNELQFQLIELLVRQHQNLCVVGDDDQSIYAWRGAEIKHILGFQQRFRGARVVRLEDNYRCTEPIIRIANNLVAHNRGRHPKRLAAHRSGTSVTIREYPDEHAEVEGIVREIHYLITQLNVVPADIAILFRTNEQPKLFEEELRRKKVHYRLVGGQSFFDRTEIKDLQSFLRVIENPADEVSLRRIINVPPRGISDATMETVLARAVKEKISFWKAVEPAHQAGEITPKAYAAIRSFDEMLHEFRGLFRKPRGPLAQHLNELIEKIDYKGHILKHHKSAAQQQIRQEIVGEFATSMSHYESQSHRPSLTEFLEQISLDGADFGRDEKPDQKAITLMTLHSAKGLEFPRVYLVGLEEGILPHKRSVEDENPNAVEEERRLCYVGVTRARDHLTITRASGRTKWGKKRPSVPSRFLAEMNRDWKTGDETHDAETTVIKADDEEDA